MALGRSKIKNDALPDRENSVAICAFVKIQYRHWTDRQTDRQTDICIKISCSVCIACWRAIKTNSSAC